MSTAKISINGQDKGTAWLIHEQHVVTAAHCVGAIGSAAELYFWDSALPGFRAMIPAMVMRVNARKDIALLRLSAAHPELPCLPVSKRSIAPTQVNWTGEGFPAAGANEVGSFGIHGTVALMRGALNRNGEMVPAIQLTCLQGLERYPARQMVDAEGVPIHFLAGVSGSAIVIPDKAHRVIGLVRCATSAFGAATIYATPIEDVWEEFKADLPGVDLHEWQRNSGCVRLEAGTVTSNLDQELVVAAWSEDTVKDITIDVAWGETGPLVPAVLRLVLHHPSVLRLHVRNAAAWNQRLRNYAESWIALETFDPAARVAPAVEMAQPGPVAGATHPSVAAAAMALQHLCDGYVLDRLDEKLVVLFEAPHPEDFAGYPIAVDVLARMAVTWTDWRTRLRADAALLHHFLALMVTHHGTHDCVTDPSPGAGPLTIKECLLPATIFGLAIAPFLPTALDPKHPQPGNLGREALNGHTCGIQAIKRRALDTELRAHSWTTQVVLLQMLKHRPAEWEAATETLMSSGRSRPTLNRIAPSTLVITRDADVRTAIATSMDAIRQLLQTRYDQQLQRKQDYAASADPAP